MILAPRPTFYEHGSNTAGCCPAIRTALCSFFWGAFFWPFVDRMCSFWPLPVQNAPFNLLNENKTNAIFGGVFLCALFVQNAPFKFLNENKTNANFLLWSCLAPFSFKMHLLTPKTRGNACQFFVGVFLAPFSFKMHLLTF